MQEPACRLVVLKYTLAPIARQKYISANVLSLTPDMIKSHLLTIIICMKLFLSQTVKWLNSFEVCFDLWGVYELNFIFNASV